MKYPWGLMAMLLMIAAVLEVHLDGSSIRTHIQAFTAVFCMFAHQYFERKDND